MRKFRNRPTNGYASKREARRGAELELLQKIGEISGLETQVKFELIPKQEKEHAVHYVADFVYLDAKGTKHVEDAKGVKTPLYIVKRKLMRFVHGIAVEEV